MDAKIFDLLILIIIVWSAYKGFSKGLIASAASLIALLAGIWGALQFAGWTAAKLEPHLHVDYKYLNIIGFVVTFIAIVIGIHFLAKAVEGVAKAAALGLVNKISGAAFGVIKAAFIISVLLLVANAANAKLGIIDESFKNNSIFYNPISAFAGKVYKSLDFEKAKDGMEQMKEKVEEKKEEIFT